MKENVARTKSQYNPKEEESFDLWDVLWGFTSSDIEVNAQEFLVIETRYFGWKVWNSKMKFCNSTEQSQKNTCN